MLGSSSLPLAGGPPQLSPSLLGSAAGQQHRRQLPECCPVLQLLLAQRQPLNNRQQLVPRSHGRHYLLRLRRGRQRAQHLAPHALLLLCWLVHAAVRCRAAATACGAAAGQHLHELCRPARKRQQQVGQGPVAPQAQLVLLQRLLQLGWQPQPRVAEAQAVGKLRRLRWWRRNAATLALLALAPGLVRRRRSILDRPGGSSGRVADLAAAVAAARPAVGASTSAAVAPSSSRVLVTHVARPMHHGRRAAPPCQPGRRGMTPTARSAARAQQRLSPSVRGHR